MKMVLENKILQSDRIAIIDDKGNVFTYKDLVQEAENLSCYIEERSIIFVLCDRQTETIRFLFQILYLNRIPLLLPENIDKELFSDLVDVYHPSYIYLKKTRSSNNFKTALELDTHVLKKTEYMKYPVHPELALLMSTSGTTGSAKLVKLSYDNLCSNIEQACRRLNIQSSDKGISPLPLNHIYGFDFYFWHWRRGAALLVTEESIISKKFNDFYIKEGANNFAGTPYIYKILQRTQFWDLEKLKNLHMAMSAGEQMSKQDQINLVSMMDDKFWISYGQTECSYMITAANFAKDNIKLESVGRALDNIEISISREKGELIVKGGNVCMGYAENIEQLAEPDTNQGLLHTGDKAYIDEDGFVYLRGRLTRYIKILGKRVYLDDIEKYLQKKFVKTEFACTGTDDHIVVAHTNHEEDFNKKIVHVINSTMKIPNKFISCLYLNTIPRSDTGKIMYNKLEKLNDGK